MPKNFFPAVEKGVRLAAEKGVLAGYPVVGLKATLLDGSYHPVDSSEMAFIMAAKLAYKAAMPEAGPVILEPIHTLKAHVPNDNTGDIMGDVTKRRGRVLGMEPDEDGLQTIIAEVPLAELANFTTFIRQTTQGRGWFTTEFARYEILPEMLVPAVVEQGQEAWGNLDAIPQTTNKIIFQALSGTSLCRRGIFLRPFLARRGGRFLLTRPRLAIIMNRSKWHSCAVLCFMTLCRTPKNR